MLSYCQHTVVRSSDNVVPLGREPCGTFYFPVERSGSRLGGLRPISPNFGGCHRRGWAASGGPNGHRRLVRVSAWGAFLFFQNTGELYEPTHHLSQTHAHRSSDFCAYYSGGVPLYFFGSGAGGSLFLGRARRRPESANPRGVRPDAFGSTAGVPTAFVRRDGADGSSVLFSKTVDAPIDGAPLGSGGGDFVRRHSIRSGRGFRLPSGLFGHGRP